MSETIPQDVLKVATQAFADADYVETVPEAIAIIARALMAERQRCARVAEKCEREATGPMGQAYLGMAIAVAIHGGTDARTPVTHDPA